MRPDILASFFALTFRAFGFNPTLSRRYGMVRKETSPEFFEDATVADSETDRAPNRAFTEQFICGCGRK